MEKAVGHRIFLLSPAYAGGERARMILREQAQFPLARRLRGKSGAPIADVFTFLSGLYFRGKIAYATAFARPAHGTPGVLVITPTRGLIDAPGSLAERTAALAPSPAGPRMPFTARDIRVVGGPRPGRNSQPSQNTNSHQPLKVLVSLKRPDCDTL